MRMARLPTPLSRLATRRMARYGALAAVAFALGSVQIPRVLQRRYGSQPVTDHFDLEWGDGKRIRFNAAGSTTVEVTTSPALGATAAVLDMGKAVIPVLVLRRAFPDSHEGVVWATAVAIGQMLPPQHRFRGGRGEAILTGTALALDPASVPVSVAISQVAGIYLMRDPLLAAHAWTGVLTLYFLARGQRDLAAWTLAVNAVRWTASIPEMLAMARYKRAGEFETREFHEAFEENHIGYIHKWLRERRLIHYDYMDEDAVETESEARAGRPVQMR